MEILAKNSTLMIIGIIAICLLLIHPVVVFSAPPIVVYTILGL